MASRSPSAISRSATHRRPRPRTAHRRALLQVITEPATSAHARHAAPHHRSHRRGSRQPSAFRGRPARARLRPHHRQLAAPRPAVVDPRRGHHRGALRRRPPRVRHDRRASPRTSPTSSSTSRTSWSPPSRPTRSRAGSTCAAPADVTAGDIECPTEVEVLNKDLDIATLNAKGSPGRRPHGRAGPWLPLERPRHREPHHRRHSGRCHLLARATRCMFEVEPTRVEQRTNYDRLVLDIETDGSITPGGSTRLGRRDAALAGRAGRHPERRAAGPRARRSRRRRRQLAGPRPTDRGSRSVGASEQLPEAGADQHDRRAAHQDRRRPAEHHQLRAEEPGRGQAEARRARPHAARRSRPKD